MKHRAKIKAFVRRIAERFHPERIILFGSYAYGKPIRDSDVDLMVVMKTRKRQVEQAIEIRQAVKFDLPLDLLVRTPQVLRKRLRLGDFFLQDVVEKGQVLYERARA